MPWRIMQCENAIMAEAGGHWICALVGVGTHWGMGDAESGSLATKAGVLVGDDESGRERESESADWVCAFADMRSVG